MSMHTIQKVPHVHGKSLESGREFIDSMGWFVCRCERFWIRQYLPGFPALETRDSGEVWKEPISSSSSSCENGPRYLPLSNLDCIMSLKMSAKMSANISVDCLLSGV